MVRRKITVRHLCRIPFIVVKVSGIRALSLDLLLIVASLVLKINVEPQRYLRSSTARRTVLIYEYDGFVASSGT